MIEYVLDADAIPPVRFGISALSEVGQSLKLLRAPERAPFHASWIRAGYARLDDPDAAVLDALVSPQLWTPDFLHPPSTGTTTGFAAELDAIQAGRELMADYTSLHVGGDVPEALRGDSGEVRERIVHALRSFWTTCFEPAWPGIRRVLNSDLLHRGERIASRGLPAALAELGDQVLLKGRKLVIRLNREGALTYRKSLGQDELVLTPSVFTDRIAVPNTEHASPQIVYPARGRGNVRASEAKQAGTALRRLIGAGKSQLLLLLSEPRTTAELSDLCSVTPSAISQQLGVLTRGGLTQGTRSGKYVLYRRTALGDALVAAGE
ncbi:hypothetical protein ACFOWZ_42505 [Lentzea rhizosphaerae]|uniref:HTH arsR-type domain-containing protein n=1 Tax=Lentzea rhizosphaerae TaxID=2041025 RepID=A0ABV8C8X5_9PSEU